eukprot:XP_016665148.1 PREDICTED: uncharacterized protein LOC107885899 [Acyrthosiphon pisum]
MAPKKTRVQNTPTCKRKIIQRMKNLVRKGNDSTGPNLFHNILPSPISSNDTTSQQTNNCSQVDQNYASPFAPISAPEKCMVNRYPNDGLIGDSSILEIKCPFSAKDTSNAVDAVNNKLLQCCVVVGDSIQLKKNHSYYYQVIGQLHVSHRKTCYFVIYAANWINVEKIMYDPTFWDLKMINYLTTFYLEVLLPEIVDPLYPKRMLKTDIREYKTGD